MSQNQKPVLWRRLIKKEVDIMIFRLYEVNFDLTCEGHLNTSKTYFMDILRCFHDHQMWP